MPDTYDLPQLLRINKHKVHLLNYPKAGDRVLDLCKSFVDTMTIESLRQAVAPYDANNVLELAQTSFAEYFQSLDQQFIVAVDGFFASAQDYYTLCLELLCLGMITKSPGDPELPCSQTGILARRYSLGLHVYGKLIDDAELQWNQQEADIQKRYEEYCTSIEDFTEHKQDDPDLAPAQKARVFLNALKARNERGWLRCERTGDAIRGDMDVDPNIDSWLIFNPSILGKAEELFIACPSLTIRPLMDMLDHCVDIYLEDYQEKGFNPVWHAKRGRNVFFFLSNILKIAQEIDQAKQTDYASMII